MRTINPPSHSAVLQPAMNRRLGRLKQEAVAAINAKQGHRADRILSEIIKKDPGDIDAALLLIDLCAASQDFSRACILAETTMAALGQRSEILASYGKALYVLGQYTKALSAYWRAIQAGDIALDTLVGTIHCLDRTNQQLVDSAGKKYDVFYFLNMIFENYPEQRTAFYPYFLELTWLQQLDDPSILRPEILEEILALNAQTGCLLSRLAQMDWSQLFGHDQPQFDHWSFEEFIAAIDHLPHFKRLMNRDIIKDEASERFLTAFRTTAFRRAHDDIQDPTLSQALEILVALASQCFKTEYVYHLSDEDQRHASALALRIQNDLDSDRDPDPNALCLLAMASPITGIRGIEKLATLPTSHPLYPLIVEQIIEPGEEQGLKQNMASLVAISTDSAHVRDMYESNPYPRWLDLPPGRLAIRQAQSLVDILAMHVPGCDMSYFARLSKAQILIAGCGTGSNIALSYRRFRFCKITALDLSLSSLAYAQRMTSQLRDAEIEFLHGDILGLKMVGRDFDIIESYGVLHHMKNPMEGWRILVERLQPGGLMFIGLYSRKARRAIDQIRTELAAQNSDGSIAEIRAARKRLLALPTDDPRRKAMGCEDFYSVSGCRDLLFHVQETNYDLSEIKSMIDALGLKFIDLQLDQNTRRAIQQDYPQLGSLDYQEQWLDFYSAFEDRHPDTFIQMYQLVLQKPLGPNPPAIRR